jgi:TetR/AcrR family transcriptional regulator, ethionamide resistance regulator
MPATSKIPGAGAGKGRRRARSRGDLKEAAILACAWELLAAKPVAEITIDDLAAGAGISRPTFYFYFDSRDAVIRALSEQVGDGLIDIGAGPLNRAAQTPGATIRAIAEEYMQRWLREGPVLRAMAPLYESDPEHRAFWDGITGRIREAISRAIEEERAAGRAMPGPPDASDLAGILIGMFWRAGYELSLAPQPEDITARVVDTLTAVCLRAIYGTPLREQGII